MLDRRILAILILCVLCFACNDTDNVHVGLRTGEYFCSGAPVAQNAAALVCGSNVDVDIMELVVAIGGPTTSTTIKGLHFDVVYPRDRFSYVDGSASLIADNFLTWGGGVCAASACTDPPQNIGKFCASNAACNAPGVNMPAVTANELTDRLRITIDRANPADGVGATLGGQRKVLRFQLRAATLTRSIDPTLLKFQSAAAVNPTDTPIASILFKDQLLLWVH